jgi:hypothetical protein
MDEQTVIAQQDSLRTQRAFVSFLSSAFGLDQTYAGQDGYATNYPRGYQVLGPNGAVGVEGAPISNTQTRAIVLSPGMLILGAIVVGVLVMGNK